MTEEMTKKLIEKKKEELAMTGGVIKPGARQCKTCMHRLEDTQYTKGYEKAMCYIFPENKPKEVFWENKDCEYYEKKEEE